MKLLTALIYGWKSPPRFLLRQVGGGNGYISVNTILYILIKSDSRSNRINTMLMNDIFSIASEYYEQDPVSI